MRLYLEVNDYKADVIYLFFIFHYHFPPYVAEHTTERGSNLRSLLFSNSGLGSITSLKNQISESAVREDLWFFVLIRGYT